MNKKTKVAIIGVIALILVTIGITYAYWLITRTQQGENVITTGCLDITLNGENDITLGNQFPISDEDGMKLTPYTFTVTNNCNTSVDYQIALEALGAESTAIDSAAIKAVLNENTPKVLFDYVGADTTVSNAYEAYTLGYGTLTATGNVGSSVSYSLRLWIDEDAPISEMNKTFKSKITVTVGQGISNIKEGTVLSSLILEAAETNNYLYETAPDFSKDIVAGEYGLYSAEDDYGTSYYFRGDVTNNYVKLGTWKETNAQYKVVGPNSFYDSLEECQADEYHINYNSPCLKLYGAKDDSMYWRIVRINGDGTIRLVYDGTSPITNNEIHSSSIGMASFNNVESTDLKYAGYTYEVDGVQTDSTIKGVVDAWYETNLEADYGKYIADSIFCNDRQVTSTSGNYQYFGAYDRLETNKSPKLSCTQDADKYTVSSAKGNGLLTKPIGLITADEVIFAGANRLEIPYYLYSYESYEWTMTPYKLDLEFEELSVGTIHVTGELGNFLTFSSINVRPVINIKADVQFTGNGTIDRPYEIVMK